MQTSGLPTRTPTPFANSGAKNTIPVASQISITPGAASYTDGFPPLTRTPIAAGGVPPFGVDFNGILNAITVAIQWQNAGGQYSYDAAFSSAIGGYPKGAILARSGFDGFWVSSTENNTTNPDAAGAGWNMLSAQGWDYVVGTGSANIYTASYSPAILSLKDGLTLHSTAVAANTGASTFSPNGLTAKPILSLGQVALIGGELVVNGRFSVRYSATLDSWILLSASGGNALAGRLLRTSIYSRVGGVQMVSVNGGTPTTTGATTFTQLASTTQIIAEGVGAGGGSGGTTTSSSSQYSITGGASGGVYGRGVYPAPGTPLAVTIGLGGTAGAVGAAGTAGGSSSLGSLLSVGGGSFSGGQTALTGNGVIGGSSTTYTVTGANLFSANGGYGTYGVALGNFISGTGGSSYFGPGPAPVLSTSPGQPGVSPGSGASGACTIPSGAGQVGGRGADGMIIIYEYA